MKTKKIELDVDFIGGQTSLTKKKRRQLASLLKKINPRKQKDFVQSQDCQTIDLKKLLLTRTV